LGSDAGFGAAEAALAAGFFAAGFFVAGALAGILGFG
jgi:hypothetical protein